MPLTHYPRHAYILQNVTKQKEAEQELRRHKENLEVVIKERTEQLYESEERYYHLSSFN